MRRAPGAFALDREGGTRLFGVEVVHGPGEDVRVAAFDERARLPVHPHADLIHQPRRASDRGAETGTAEKVVGNAVPRGIAAFGDDMPAGIEGHDVVAGPGILQVQGPAGEGLVKEPGAPAEGAGGFRPHPGLQLGGLNCLEGGDQHPEVDGLMAQYEAEIRGDRSVRGVLSRIQFHGPRAVHLGSPRTCPDVALYRRRRDCQVQFAPEPSLADGAPFFLSHGGCHSETVIVVQTGLE